MRIVCAWCGRVVGETDGPEGESHSICLPCIVEHFPEALEVVGVVEAAEPCASRPGWGGARLVAGLAVVVAVALLGCLWLWF